MDSEPNAIRSIESRLERLEELAGFADRRHDELNAALLDLAGRLDRVARRINDVASGLENLVASAASADNGPAPSTEGARTATTPDRPSDHSVGP